MEVLVDDKWDDDRFKSARALYSRAIARVLNAEVPGTRPLSYQEEQLLVSLPADPGKSKKIIYARIFGIDV
ncbi:MAG: hypothetical protein G01um101416_761 [Microgenomates group bacterium Gr01-1014_16]|nr:MAG: hypothetical protein G01um101416_761 [Microgenomates group bacterium Gr01-1014_16]